MLCWADKVGVLWAFLLYAGLFLIAQDRAGIFTLAVTGELLTLILPVWIALRLIDWAAGGPRRRRGSLTVRPMDRY